MCSVCLLSILASAFPYQPRSRRGHEKQSLTHTHSHLASYLYILSDLCALRPGLSGYTNSARFRVAAGSSFQ